MGENSVRKSFVERFWKHRRNNVKELYVKKGDNEYEEVEFKDLLSLQFDYDGDGVLLITKENYLRLKMAVDLNDRYSVGNADNEKTAQYYIKNDYLKGGHLVNDIDVIKEVCKRIDKENSTHLSVVGNRKIKISNKTNNGIDIMAKRIANVENLEQRLKDGDPSLVQELGGKVGERHAVSFASKFCTEVSLTAFGNTKFAKFDSVMRDVLPIYAYNYLGKTYWKKTTRGNYVSTFSADKYKEYLEVVTDVVDATKHSFPDVDIDKLDLMLWYYYKGKSNVLNEFVKNHTREIIL